MSLSANKNFDLQVTGSNVNTWGVVNNANFSIVDLNLGGRLNLSVAGSSNVTVTANQAQNLMHVLSGVLTGNIDYIFPALGSFYLVTNNTTGSFSLTAKIAGGGSGVVIPQGSSAVLFCNPDAPSITGQVFGASNYFIGGVSTGSGNAQVVATLSPAGYTLANGNLVTWNAGFSNSGAMTLNAGGTGAITVKKSLNASGLADLSGNEVKSGARYAAIYDSTSGFYILLNQALGALAALNLSANFQNSGGNIDFAAAPVLPTATVATTQAVADNSTKLATTAYVDRSGNNSQGLKTVSASSPSGGNNGDIWYQT